MTSIAWFKSATIFTTSVVISSLVSPVSARPITSSGVTSAAATGGSFPIRGTVSMTGGYSERLRSIDPDTGLSYIETDGVTGVSGLSVSYDSRSGRYTIKAPSDLLSYTTTGSRTTSGYYDVYKTNTTKSTDTLKLYGNVRSTGSALPIKLSYVSFGYWQHIDKSTKANHEYFFYFGSRTPTSGVPKTGSATYKTLLTGNSVVTGAGAGNYDVTGTAAFTANFANGTVSTQIALNRSVTSPVLPALGTYAGTANISVGTFTGNFSSTDKFFWSGGFSGSFFGPSANEIGYAFSVDRINPDPYSGATMKFSTESVMGVVVGTRN